jgi:hypothetical protein
MNWYRLARRINDVETLASGDPKRIVRRAKNKVVGRALSRAGVFKALWGWPR